MEMVVHIRGGKRKKHIPKLHKKNLVLVHPNGLILTMLSSANDSFQTASASTRSSGCVETHSVSIAGHRVLLGQKYRPAD